MKTTFTLLSIASIIGTLTPANGYNYQSLRGKDTVLTKSTQLVEEESSGTKWPPLVPTSHFFTHGMHGTKKPRGDWKPHHSHSGELVVHMSRPPYSQCTLTGKSGPYNFGVGHLHSDEHYCKHTKCWVFPGKSALVLFYCMNSCV